MEYGASDGTGLYVNVKPHPGIAGTGILRVVSDCPALKDTLEFSFLITHAAGFAPIQSMQAMAYERTHLSACARQYGGTGDSIRIRFSALDSSSEGYLFRRLQEGVSYVIRTGEPDSVTPINIADTVALRMSGNMVQLRTDSGWQPAGGADFPYFLQDTAFSRVAHVQRNAPATVLFGTLEGSSASAAGWIAMHEAGVGLVYYLENGAPSICGASRTRVRKVAL